jgi:hypothetical protein
VVLTVLEEKGVGLILDICEVSTMNFNWLLFTPLWSHSPVLQPQPIHSEGGDNSGGGKNTSHTTKALTRMKKKISGPTMTRKNWLFSISTFHYPYFNYYVVFTN